LVSDGCGKNTAQEFTKIIYIAEEKQFNKDSNFDFKSIESIFAQFFQMITVSRFEREI
jgi:hypothetical protein